VAVIAATWELHKKISFESLADEFARNPVKAWRNYGSVVSLSAEAAIRDTTVVLRHVNTGREGPWDEVRRQYKPWFRGHPGMRYFLHIDLSQNRDATGVALSHREKSGRVVVDFMHKVAVDLGRDINFSDLRERFVYPLTQLGFHLQMITFDRFQSAETMQILQEKGYETDLLSVDKTMEPYDTLIELVLAGPARIDYYVHPVFIRELEELQLVDGKKYDHPRKSRTGAPGSKDVADAVAGSVFSCLRYEMENPRMAAGHLTIFRKAPVRFGDERGF
jgi:hypothetical protein